MHFMGMQRWKEWMVSSWVCSILQYLSTQLACFLKGTFPAAFILGVQTTGVLAVSSRQPPHSPTLSMDRGARLHSFRLWDRFCSMCRTTGYAWNPPLCSTPQDQAVWWSQTWILASLLNSAMWQRASYFSLALAIAPEWARLQGLSCFNFFFPWRRGLPFDSVFEA